MSLTDKFRKPISREYLEKQDKVIDAITPSSDNGYSDFLEIKQGENRFRIYPGHPDENDAFDTFIVPVNRWWLPMMREVEDNGRKVTKKVIKPVFDGRVHSTTNKDIVATYIELLEEKLKQSGASEQQIADSLLKVYGSYKSNVRGITGKPEWVMYAKDMNSGKFGRLTVGKGVKNDINNIIATENSRDTIGTLSYNPLTDPELGRLLIIKYDKNATRAQDYYITSIDSSFDPATQKVHLYPLSEQDLQNFLTYPSLKEMYVDCYTTRDFELALEGLQLFDTEMGFGMFSYEPFLRKCEEYASLYPAPKSQDKQEKKGQTSSSNLRTTPASEPIQPQTEEKGDLPWEKEENKQPIQPTNTTPQTSPQEPALDEDLKRRLEEIKARMGKK